MREAELRKRAECFVCGKKPGEWPLPIFHVIRMERFIVDLNAVVRQSGLAMHMGSALLAQVMGPDEDMAKSLSKAELTVCEGCILEKRMCHLFEAYEHCESLNQSDTDETATA